MRQFRDMALIFSIVGGMLVVVLGAYTLFHPEIIRMVWPHGASAAASETPVPNP